MFVTKLQDKAISILAYLVSLCRYGRGDNMNAIDRIEKTAPKFKFRTSRIDKHMLKIYTNDFRLDSWIVEQRGYKLRLLHMSKHHTGNKCSYHLQREIYYKNWIWILENIRSHNRYVMKYRWNTRENLVDRKLKEYRENKYESKLR